MGLFLLAFEKTCICYNLNAIFHLKIKLHIYKRDEIYQNEILTNSSSGHNFQTGIKLCRPENTDEFLISRWCFFGQLFCILSKAFVGQAMASKNKSQKIKKIGNVHNFVLLSKSHVKFRLEVLN